REEERHHRRRRPGARAGQHSDRPVRRAGRLRSRRRVPALGGGVLHHGRVAAGRRRVDQGRVVRLARNMLLAASTNAWLRHRATKTAFVRRSVSKFMPGEQLQDAMAAAAKQEAAGVGTIFTKLGENVTRKEEAEEVTRHYLDVLDRVQAA